MEGEYKAITAVMYGKLGDEYAVYGLQSKAPEKRIIDMLEFAEVVYVALDPDAYVPEGNTNRVAVFEVAKQIGLARARLVIPPKNIKFDDAMADGYNFASAVNMAINPEALK